MNERRDPRQGRIGPWRLLDLVFATMPFRVAMLGGFGALPEYGAADARIANSDPDDELPHSNISDSEQQVAIQRERDRRWLAARG
jgi:hypothetical protein